jgi:hypothetical protein
MQSAFITKMGSAGSSPKRIKNTVAMVYACGIISNPFIVFVGLEETSYPFVLQPLLTNFTDIRVIIVENYIEAYTRENPYNFRCNLAAGGKSTPYSLTRKQINFCKKIMERGKFPYAHIDLMILENDIFIYRKLP